MIRIRRGAEPRPLAKARARVLPGLRPNGPPTRDDLPGDYKLAHPALWRSQHFKCCYCETREQSKRNDVEHFRPAMRADRSPGSPATHGYWWLAFTWKNLLFSCRNCNQAPAKLDQFPLDVGSQPLVAEDLPPGGEKPFLIDPAAESGIRHIEFVEEARPDGVRRWRPRGRGGSARGNKTIQVCMLDRPDLLELYAQHVEVNVRPDLDALDAALAAGDPAAVAAEWSRFCARHLQPAQVYVGLVHDVLSHHVPAKTRRAFGLSLPSL